MSSRLYSKFVSKSGSQPLPTAVAVPLSPQALAADLILSLENARGDYIYHRYISVGPKIAVLEERLGAALAAETDADLVHDLSLVRGSLLVLKGRSLARDKSPGSRAVFEEAANLFRAHAVQDTTPLAARFKTDHGIALFRLGLRREAAALLEDICINGSAPPDALAYLGYSRMEAGNWEGAEECLRASLEFCPGQPTVLYWLGRSRQKSGRRAEAEGSYCRGGDYALSVQDFETATLCGLRALRIEPSSKAGLSLAVEGSRQRGKTSQALLIVNRYLRGQPEWTHALAWKGMLLRECGKFEESAAVLRSIPADSPQYDWVLQELLASLYEWGTVPPQEILTVADALLERTPEHAGALCAKGSALLSLNRYEEAKSYFERALVKSSKNGAALLGLGTVMERLERRDDAFGRYRQAARSTSDEADFVKAMDGMGRTGDRLDFLDELEFLSSGPLGHFALWCRGLLMIEEGDRAGALKPLEAAIAMVTAKNQEERCQRLLIDYGHALRHVGRYSDAGRVIDRALEIDASDPDGLKLKAVFLSDIGDFELALAYVQKALEMAPKDAGLWDRAGWCKQHLIDLDGAWKAYERAYSIEKNPWYRKGLANVLANYPLQQDEARRHFEGVLEDLKYSSDPEATQERPAGNSSTLGLLGWCHYRLGRWAEAIRLFQIALEVSPDIHPLWFDLSLAFLASGRGVLAKDVYDRGCSKTEATEEPRRRGVYYIALFDLAEFARAAKTSLPAEAAEIFDGLRGRLEASGQDLTKLFWLPQTVAVAPPIGRAETLEQISADARSSGGQNRRLIFREMLRAASVRFRNDDWYRDLVLLADRDEWPVWAVQCLTYPDRMDGALVLWRPLADLLGQVHVQASRVLCQGEVCLFDAFPEALESAIATVRERLDERRMAFPYASDRGCTVDAVELLCEIGGEILGIVTSDVARELVDFQTRQLAGKGLLRTAVSS